MQHARNLVTRSCDLNTIYATSGTTPRRVASLSRFEAAPNVALPLPSGHRDDRQVLKWIDAIRGRSHHHSAAPAMS